MTRLSGIGSNFLQTPDSLSGWIKLMPVWRYRWKKMTGHNPVYNNLLDLFEMLPEDQKKSISVMPPLRWHDVVTK